MRYAKWAALVAATAALALTAGCGSDDSSGGGEEIKAPEGPQALTKLGEGEGEVNLIAWAGYVEDGSTDPKVDWVTDFEKETGCQVNVEDRQHVRRDGHADAHRPVRRRVGVRRRDAAADRRRRRRAGQHRPDPELRRRLRRPQGPAVEHASTAVTTASRTAAARTC